MTVTSTPTPPRHRPRVALAHDYLTQRGGAERVALHLARAFPGSPLHTSLYDPSSTFPELAEVDVQTSALQRIPALREDPRRALPLLARAWSSVKVAPCDVVLASSSGWAHGVKAPEGARKVVYCHNPPRWLHQREDYGVSRAQRTVMWALRPSLTRWDRAAADSADLYLANSTSVARRIEAVYEREAVVVFPPVGIDVDGPQEAVPGLEPGFWLTVARGRSYKNVAAVSAGVRAHGEGRLAIVGSDEPAGGSAPHEHWCGRVPDEQLRWLYANARALISLSYEDFGLTPVEANTFGTPTVLLRAGGFLDSTDPGVSGCFVEEATASSLAQTLRTLPTFDPHAVAAHAARFSPESFAHRVRELVLGEEMDGTGEPLVPNGSSARLPTTGEIS